MRGAIPPLPQGLHGVLLR